MGLKDIAERLAQERIRLGYTQVSFARLLGISREALRKIEAGQSEFKVNVLQAAASSGVDVQFVLTGVPSQNINAVEKEVGFSQQAIHGAVSGVGYAQSGANVQIINTNHHVTKVKAETKPGIEHITIQQRAILKELVDQVFEKENALKKSPKSHQAIWSTLNRHCGVNTYTLIAVSDFEKARKFLHTWLGRLNSSRSAPVMDGEKWRKSRYTYIKVNTKSPEDQAALQAYMQRKYQATSLTELSNDELVEVYRYVAGRRNRRN